MINKIGYACINTSLKDNFKDCRIISIYKQGIPYLKTIILHNLILTRDTLLWNVNNNILMYRATSKLIPFATHNNILEDFSFRWYEDADILEVLNQIKAIVIKNNIRLSMHPDHFTVLNSPREDVLSNSINNLIYHKDLIKKMGGTDLIIHTGGVYGDKVSAIQRFINVYNSLSKDVSTYLRLENGYRDKRHADYISPGDFFAFCDIVSSITVDLMVEAKMKESAVLELKKLIK